MKCRFHCRACGEHFYTLGAFDAHRQGEFGLGRYCDSADDLEMVSEEGTCNLALGHAADPLAGVLVYREAAHQLREAA